MDGDAIRVRVKKKYCTADNDNRRLCGFNKSNRGFMAFNAIYLHIQFITATFFSRPALMILALFFGIVAVNRWKRQSSHYRIYTPCGKVFCHKVHFIRRSFFYGDLNAAAKDKHQELNECKWH